MRNYSKTKLLFADQLRIILEIFQFLRREDAVRQVKELIVKLAEDRFTLAVLGQFKRGKSLLMNAIVEKEILPTGVLPVTSAITVLKYGSDEKLMIKRIGSDFPEYYPVSELHKFVTEKENEGNVKRIQTACVELPVDFLRRGIEFVDTPGIGSANTSNTATTLDFLPSCDAAFFVTSVDLPLSETELSFLKIIKQHIDKIFFIINKTDLITADELGEYIEFFTKTIRNETGQNVLKIFPVSGLQALRAEISNDKQLYAESRLDIVKTELVNFLSGERFDVFLKLISDKIVQILISEMKTDLFVEPQVNSDKKDNVLFYSHQEISQQLLKARSYFESYSKNSISEIKDNIISTDLFLVEKTHLQEVIRPVIPESINFSSHFHDNTEVKECMVCRYLEKYLFDFFSDWQYQIGKDEEVRHLFAKELGFCSLHTWQLIFLSSPRGASIGLTNLAEEISRRLMDASKAWPATSYLDELVNDSHNCRVCKNLYQIENEYLKQLADYIQTGNGCEDYLHSHGTCLVHLNKMLPMIKSTDMQKKLLTHMADRFDDDAEDMRSFILKNDALRRYLQNRDEDEAWQRTVARMVGKRFLSVPWTTEREI